MSKSLHPFNSKSLLCATSKNNVAPSRYKFCLYISSLYFVRLMAVISNFTRDVIMTCGDDVITMSIVEDHVVIRIVDPCDSSEVTHSFNAQFSTASVGKH